MDDRNRFTYAMATLFSLSLNAQQSCWRAVKDLPEPHLSEMIAGLVRAAMLKREQARATDAAIAAAIGRPLS